MANSVNLPDDRDLAKQVLDSQISHKKLDQGILGYIWGSSASVPNNLAALLVVFLALTGIIYTLIAAQKPPEKVGISIKDFWALISPLITLSVGYLFGDKSKKK